MAPFETTSTIRVIFRINMNTHLSTCVHAAVIFWGAPGADREGLVSVRAPLPPPACVRSAEGGNVGQGGSTQPHLPAVLGLHLAACHAASLVLRVQPEVGLIVLFTPFETSVG